MSQWFEKVPGINYLVTLWHDFFPIARAIASRTPELPGRVLADKSLLRVCREKKVLMGLLTLGDPERLTGI